MSLTQILTKRFGQFVIPLYRQGEGPQLLSHATAVLIRGKHRCWFFTAAHVFDATDTLFIPTKGDGPRMLQRSQFRGSPDLLDILVASVPSSWIEPMQESGMSFLHGRFVESRERPPPPDRCAFVGFPDKAVRIDHASRTIDVRTAVLESTFLPVSQYRDLGLNRGFHVAARFDGYVGDGADGHRTVLENFAPEGLSGGAIMHAEPNGEISMIGVATHYLKDRRFLVGSRLNRLMSQMQRERQ